MIQEWKLTGKAEVGWRHVDKIRFHGGNAADTNGTVICTWNSENLIRYHDMKNNIFLINYISCVALYF